MKKSNKKAPDFKRKTLIQLQSEQQFSVQGGERKQDTQYRDFSKYITILDQLPH